MWKWFFLSETQQSKKKQTCHVQFISLHKFEAIRAILSCSKAMKHPEPLPMDTPSYTLPSPSWAEGDNRPSPQAGQVNLIFFSEISNPAKSPKKILDTYNTYKIAYKGLCLQVDNRLAKCLPVPMSNLFNGPQKAHFHSRKFSKDRKFSENIIVKSWKFEYITPTQKIS